MKRMTDTRCLRDCRISMLFVALLVCLGLVAGCWSDSGGGTDNPNPLGEGSGDGGSGSRIADFSILGEVQYPGTAPVMENSIFEAIGNAVAPVAAEVMSPTDAIDIDALTCQRDELLLDGVWRYKADVEEIGHVAGWYELDFDDSSWGEMPVPSNFAIEDADLERFFGPVWFRKAFDVPAGMDGREIRLLFEGVDYFADVWLNGTWLGEHEGYFAPFEFSVTGTLLPGEQNLIAVKVINPWDEGQLPGGNALTDFKRYPKGVLNYHDSRPGMGGLPLGNPEDTQSLGSGGIYQSVKLIATGNAAINCVLITPRLLKNYTRAEVQIDYFITNYTSEELAVTLVGVVSGANFEIAPQWFGAHLALAPGANRVTFLVVFDEPNLWWPWDQPDLGQPSLYQLESHIVEGASSLDTHTERFGIREIVMNRYGQEAFHYFINGRRIFLRGVNYIPTNWMAYADEALYRRDIELMKQANINHIGIHAHCQKPLLYDISDEEGMMIIQDYSLQWAYYSDEPFIERSRRMIAEMVYLYYNHPSMLQWVVHNEPPYQLVLMWPGKTSLLSRLSGFFGRPIWPEFDVMTQLWPAIKGDYWSGRYLNEELFKVVEGIDGSRPVHMASGAGDAHLYIGTAEGLIIDIYHRTDAFPSEFGSQSAPHSMRWWAPPGDLWPPNRGFWRYHSMEPTMVQRYVGRFDRFASFNEFAHATQLYQAILLKYYIEHYRIDKYNPTGAQRLHFFVDWWDSAGFGIVDQYRIPKLAFEWVRNANSPILVASQLPRFWYGPGEKLEIPIYGINDYHRVLKDVTLEWELLEVPDGWILKGFRVIGRSSITVAPGTEDGLAVMSGTLPVTLGENSVSRLATVNFTTPSVIQQETHYTLRMRLIGSDGEILSSNWFHFIAVPGTYDRFGRLRYDPPEGLRPAPRFDLEVNVMSNAQPAAAVSVTVRQRNFGDVYVSVATGLTDSEGVFRAYQLGPDVYSVLVSDHDISYEQIVPMNRDTAITIDLP